jgi:Cys-tRNA(Pro) deacylase
MDNLKKVKEFFDATKVGYEFKHYSNKVKNAHEASSEIGLSPDQMLKTLLVRNGNKFVLVLIPVSHKLNFPKLKQLLGCEFSMASSEEVYKITGYEIGTVSPFCMKINIPIYLEKSALVQLKVGVGSGVKGTEIVLDPKKLQEILMANVVNFID